MFTRIKYLICLRKGHILPEPKHWLQWKEAQCGRCKERFFIGVDATGRSFKEWTMVYDWDYDNIPIPPLSITREDLQKPK